jgi:hypothetical protein
MDTSSAAGPQPVCNGCGKTPEELEEYSAELTGSTLTPTQYVRVEEGTYNPRNGHFLCTACYIKAGMPSEAGGWVAP